MTSRAQGPGGPAGPGGFILGVLALLAAVDLAVFHDLPFLREVLGFVFVTFVPGFLVLTALRLSDRPLVERFVLSVGLSVALAMLLGLVTNALLPLFGVDNPLSTGPLVIAYNVVTVALLLAIALRGRGQAVLPVVPRLSTAAVAWLLLPAFLPVATVLGMRLMNTADNNTVLLAVLFLIVLYVAALALWRRRVPETVYPPALLFVGLSLTLMFALRSNHLLGADTHEEYYLFMTAYNNSHWSITGAGPPDSTVSVSILPCVVQSFMSMEPEMLFKLLYAFLGAPIAVAVYALTRKYLSPYGAFLASLFVMSQMAFLWTPAMARQTVAVLFFSLVLLVVFHERIRRSGQTFLTLVFGASVILSHYTTAYASLGLLVITWLGIQVVRWLGQRGPRKEAVQPASATLGEMSPGAYLSFATVAALLVVAFLWYGVVVEAALRLPVHFLSGVISNLQATFLQSGQRATVIEMAFGFGTLGKGFPQHAKLVLSWLGVVFIGVGFLAVAAGHLLGRERIDRLSGRLRVLSLLRLGSDYIVLVAACCAMLVIWVVIPGISRGYNITRLFYQLAVPLSVLFVIGGAVVARIARLAGTWVLLPVAALYFLSMTGVLYQLSGYPESVVLNSEGFYYDHLYLHDQESEAAGWLRDYGELDFERVYTVPMGINVLTSQAGIRHPDNQSLLVSNSALDGYVFLRYNSVVNGTVVTRDGEMDLADYRWKYAGGNRIYVNGGAEIWK